jgi:hypothetical protein
VLAPERKGVPRKCSISTQEQNYLGTEALPKRLIDLANDRLEQYFVDEPDPELKHVLCWIRYQNPLFKDVEIMDQKSTGFYLDRRV